MSGDGEKRESKWDRIREHDAAKKKAEAEAKAREQLFVPVVDDIMEIFLGPIPMHLNLGDDFGRPSSVIGWARAYRKGDGTIHLAIHLDAEASKQFKDMAEVFELKAVGFAGIAKQREE